MQRLVVIFPAIVIVMALVPGCSVPTGGAPDVDALVAFAEANRDPSVIGPYTEVGEPLCPEDVEPSGTDGGDNDVRDITGWFLRRYCDGVYSGVLLTEVESEPLGAFFWRIHTKPGGCEGYDFAVVAWPLKIGGRRAEVIATPSCSESSWQWVDAADAVTWNCCYLQLEFRDTALGSPHNFLFRAGVQAPGETGEAIDLVPNDGPGQFVVTADP